MENKEYTDCVIQLVKITNSMVKDFAEDPNPAKTLETMTATEIELRERQELNHIMEEIECDECTMRLLKSINNAVKDYIAKQKKEQ